MRRLAVAAVVEQGMSVAAAGRVFRVSRQTVSGWVNGFRRQGEASLAAGRRGRRAGEQQALPPWMQGQLVQTTRGRNPDQLRLPFFLWTREAVRELIRTRYGAELALTTVGQYLKRWGFTPQKPVQRAFEQNPVAVARWLEREYPAIEARAKREGARILWADEMGLRSDQAAGRSFWPRGRTPVVGYSPELNPAELLEQRHQARRTHPADHATQTSSSTAPAATSTAARNNHT